MFSGVFMLPAWLQKIIDDFIKNFITDDRWQYIAKGLLVTLEITALAVLIGYALGVIVAVIRSTYDKNAAYINNRFLLFILRTLDAICRVYLTVIRGTPVVLQLLIAYFVIFVSSKNAVMVAVIAFGFNSGAYVAEIIRSGIMSIDNGQFEAGRSLGFNYVQTMIYIVLPQAFKNILPALANEFIVLLKETSVAGYVGLQDMTKAGNVILSQTYSAFMPLVAVALIYLLIVMLFSRFVSWIERRLRNSER